jgi:hypothetical protein
LLDESQRIAQTGSWKYNIKTDGLIWSKGHYRVFELEELPENELDAYRSHISCRPYRFDELSENIVKQVQILKLVIE